MTKPEWRDSKLINLERDGIFFTLPGHKEANKLEMLLLGKIDHGFDLLW